MNIKLSISAFLIVSSSIAIGQFSNFNTQKNWSMNKKEFLFGGGATQFLGDLGGGAGIGKDYSLADMNFRKTNFNLSLGYRYRFHPVFATSTSLNFGKYGASDRLPGVNPGRAARTIDIKSTLISLSQRFEYLIYVNEKVGKRNNIPGLKGMKDKNTQFYIFTGLGLAYFNPQGGPGTKYEGTFLRPLATEGQGYAGGAKGYKVITAIVPFGFGYRVGLGRMWRMIIEATYFKTFTDYMDDTSTTYFSYAANDIPGSAQAIYYSNPSENWSTFTNGDKRGDNERDAFFYINVTFSKNITYKSYQRGKPIKWKGVRAKF
ncbi:MAG: hypothetical protein ACK5B9_09875 [Flavobacteriia bacterium]|jgi:hypothetical protein